VNGMHFSTNDPNFFDGLLNFQTILFFVILILLIWAVYNHFKEQGNSNSNYNQNQQYLRNRTVGRNYSREQVQSDMLQNDEDFTAWGVEQDSQQSTMQKNDENPN
jgi:membrane protein implicated in regulation of membrane protease activity